MLTDPKDFLKNTYHRIVNEVKADALYRKYLHLYENTLYYRNTPLETTPKGQLILAGSGKASLNMANAFLDYCPHTWHKSLFISPIDAPGGPFDVMTGDHPIPGHKSLDAGKRMFELISSLKEDDTLIYFLSGGSSSLMEYPVEGLNSEDLRSATKAFLARGLNINEINTLRAALSRVKAGKLAAVCKARCYVFVLSDVMGNDLSIIGSGPFYKSSAHIDKIKEIVTRYRLDEVLPTSVMDHLLSYEAMEHRDIPHYLIGSNMDLLQAAETACFDEGVKPLAFPESLFGDAQHCGKMIADMINLYGGDKPVCMIFGGETTVTLNDKPGLGGRSQELALSILEEIKDRPGIHLLSAGSDGMDGVGGAAGAIISSETYQKTEKLGLSIQSYLTNHDSYHFHEQCGSLIITGYSGTNVGDVVLALMDDE